MKPSGVHHVAICVADARKGLTFYRDVLGMTQLPRPDLGPGTGSTLAASRCT
jgi:catechol 2,3-dioxygenase-like lactoylglutathione lyase family enzyme